MATKESNRSRVACKASAACGLIKRVTHRIPKLADDILGSRHLSHEEKFDRAMEILDHLTECIDEEAPDPQWWRDYFGLTGQHMVLTDEGWEPGDIDREGIEIIDEVNAPKPNR